MVDETTRPDPGPPQAAGGTGTATGTTDGATEPGGPGRAGAGALRTVAVVGGLVVLAGGIPLAVALGVLHEPRWYPALDLAQTELRVRDVGTRDPPLLGLTGRFFGFGERGSHPGPLSFWALWPVHALLGGTAWALQAATVALNLLALTTATWIAHRRGGARLAVVVALALAVLAHAYTAERLTTPWNPFLPVLWWVVLLLAVWSVLCDDVALLPVAVFAGSFCAQTHIPYLGPVGGLGLLVTGVAGGRCLVGWLAAHRRPASAARVGPGTPSPGRWVRWGAGSALLLVVLWLPPLVEQLTTDLGNLGLLREHFTHPIEEVVGFDGGLDAWLAHLDVRRLWRLDSGPDIDEAPAGEPVPGLALLAVWGVAATMAWRRRRLRPDLWRLHLTVGTAALLGLVAASRVLGTLWNYLLLWAWGTTVLMVLATLLTLPLAVPRRTRPADDRPSRAPRRLGLSRLRRLPGPLRGLRLPGTLRRLGPIPALGRHAAVAVPLTALVLVSAAYSYDAAHTQPLDLPESRTLARVAPPVVRALRQGRLAGGGTVPGGGAGGRYLVRWHDTEVATTGVGFGLLLELERQGLDVGGPESDESAVVPHRVRDLDEATATVNVVIGDRPLARWRATPGAVEVVHTDPRTPRERARFTRLRDEVVAGLREAGLDDLAATLQLNVLTAAMDERMPPGLEAKAGELLAIGGPTAVFVAPPPG
jgi:hypothetical protein